MASTSYQELIIVPIILTVMNAIINVTSGFPTEYIIKDLGISFGVSIVDEVIFNYLIDPYVLSGKTSVSFVDVLGKPFVYAGSTHALRTYLQNDYSKSFCYSLIESCIIYMSSDYMSIPFQSLI